MKKLIVAASLCILGSSLAANLHPASADVRVNAGVYSSRGDIDLESQPNVVLVPRTHVYYEDYGPYDVYRYHHTWYVNQGGTWYRASSYHGPFTEVRYERVPQQVVMVPMDYRRHWNSNSNDNNNNGRWNMESSHRRHHRD